MSSDTSLTQRRIFWFWVPLAVMWLIMAVEQPAITAIVSRLPDATLNLAAFGLAFSFALIVESPVIMLLTAATALGGQRRPYRRLLQFTQILAVTQTLVHLAFALSPAYAFVVRDLIGAPAEVIELSRQSFLLMLLWTPMIAFRRLFEGTMIRWGRPQRLTIVIVARIGAMLAVLLAGWAADRWPGALVGGAALSIGVTAGALTAYLLARPLIAEHLSVDRPDDQPLAWPRLLAFYAPLALTTLIVMVNRPIVSFGLSHAPLPLESLAVWPVVVALLFVGNSFGTAFQEVAVALLARPGAHAELRRYAWGLALASGALFALLAFTPGAAWWYREVSGLDPELVSLVLVPTMLVVPLPALTALVSWQRAQLVHTQRTRPVSAAVALNMGTLLLVLLALPHVVPESGAVLAALATTLASGAECAYLAWSAHRQGAAPVAAPEAEALPAVGWQAPAEE
jgi:hypothetical protein